MSCGFSSALNPAHGARAMPSAKSLAIDLYCGLGGWAEGLLAEGYDVIGFDIERHQYGDHRYPAQLVIQDVLTLHGEQFKDAALIVASPPCQAYSYRAMPWKRAKALPPPDNTLFEACFRIQREACEAAGHHIPLIVENVRGAQKWVGRARWNFGSYYLWGDVPALMPIIAARASLKNDAAPGGATHRSDGHSNWHPIKVPGHLNLRDGNSHTRHITNPGEHGTKQGGTWWHDEGSISRSTAAGSPRRKAASAMIAKIPLPLSQHIARVFQTPPAERGDVAGENR